MLNFTRQLGARIVGGGPSEGAGLQTALFKRVSSTSAAPSPDPGSPPNAHGDNPKANPQGGTVPFGIVTEDIRATTGVQTFKLSKFGKVSGALFIVNNAKLSALTGDENLSSVGVTDGVNHWVYASVDQHGVGTMDSYRRGATDRVVMFLDGNGVPYIEMSFLNFVNNGVRLEVTLTTGDVRALTVILFSDEIDVAVGTQALPTENSTIVVTPNIQADALFTLGAVTAFDDSTAAGCSNSLGFASYDGVNINQVCFGPISIDGAATGDPRAASQPDRIWHRAADDGEIEVTAVTGTTFSIKATNRDLSTIDIGWFALQLNGGQAWAGKLTAPTAAGNASFTGMGMKPNCGFMIPTALIGEDTDYNNSTAGTYGFSAFNGDTEICYSWGTEDASAAADTQSKLDISNAIDLPNDDGASTLYAGSLLSFDNDGATFDFTTAGPASPGLWPALFFRI